MFLRKELRRYRLELMNRDDNYNKLFTNRQIQYREVCPQRYNLTGLNVKEVVQTSYLPDLPKNPIAK